MRQSSPSVRLSHIGPAGAPGAILRTCQLSRCIHRQGRDLPLAISGPRAADDHGLTTRAHGSWCRTAASANLGSCVAGSTRSGLLPVDAQAPVRMSHLAHAVRELWLHLPDAIGVVKLERSKSDAKAALGPKDLAAPGSPRSMRERTRSSA
jgi:hypothetical protein